MGTLRLMPKILALRAVHKQTAASTSASPLRREQHGSTGGEPRLRLSNPPSKSAHTPSLSVSVGHFASFGGVVGGVAFDGVGGHAGGGFGFGLGHDGQPETIVNSTTLKERKRAMEVVLLIAMVYVYDQMVWSDVVTS
ncbi:hypothetical protein Leryth_013245 [Lithospermum erythrorhizon]|uniref:Uncharacterized protein n=1 Tax=Lithospermum erythrorhizon TaxID=34254 RepID=A0AAV3PGI3_LITER|nr:hypothetical protein Leryth_013245 [Lithospermum erythrorhizon]